MSPCVDESDNKDETPQQILVNIGVQRPSLKIVPTLYSYLRTVNGLKGRHPGECGRVCEGSCYDWVSLSSMERKDFASGP